GDGALMVSAGADLRGDVDAVAAVGQRAPEEIPRDPKKVSGAARGLRIARAAGTPLCRGAGTASNRHELRAHAADDQVERYRLRIDEKDGERAVRHLRGHVGRADTPENPGDEVRHRHLLRSAACGIRSERDDRHAVLEALRFHDLEVDEETELPLI